MMRGHREKGVLGRDLIGPASPQIAGRSGGAAIIGGPTLTRTFGCNSCAGTNITSVARPVDLVGSLALITVGVSFHDVCIDREGFDETGGMSGSCARLGVVGDQLRAIVERIASKIRELTEAKKEIYQEAKGNGFDVKIHREVIRMACAAATLVCGRASGPPAEREPPERPPPAPGPLPPPDPAATRFPKCRRRPTRSVPGGPTECRARGSPAKTGLGIKRPGTCSQRASLQQHGDERR
jgi:GapR-like, DNA-binding domain